MIALYVYISIAVLQRSDVPDFMMRVGSVEIWVGIGTAHMATFILTFMGDNEGEWDPLWAPLIRPTKASIFIGRSILIAAVCNVLFWFPYMYVTLDRLAPVRALAATFLLTTTYTAVHWALRPENIFSWPILRFLRDPGFGTQPLLSPFVERAIARRPAMPFDDWLPELLRCCELAVNSNRLANSENPGEGEIDGLEFTGLLLVKLASGTCVLRYKKRLSREGFQSIRSFLRSVAKLDTRQPDQAAWQAAVRQAQSVLDLRGTLVRSSNR